MDDAWARLGAAGTVDLAAALAPIAQAAAAVLPFPNPLGVPAPGAAAGHPA